MARNQATDLLNDEKIPLEKAKVFIVAEITGFDETLGRRAKAILDDQIHNIIVVDEPVTRMMQCRPAGITETDLKSMEMWDEPEVFKKKFAPHFTDQENLSDKAIIDFEYDGTPESVAWLAHELGHAIADNTQVENGKSFRDFSSDEMEQQAYLVQTIVVNAVAKQQENAPEVRGKLGLSIVQNFNSESKRPEQVQSATHLYEQAVAKIGAERTQFLMTVMKGADVSEHNLSTPNNDFTSKP